MDEVHPDKKLLEQRRFQQRIQVLFSHMREQGNARAWWKSSELN